MKIALISQTFDHVAPPRQNSVGIWTYQVATRLARSHAVIVYTNEKDQAARKNPPEPFTYRFTRLTSSKRLRRFSDRLSKWLFGGSGARQRLVGFDLYSLLYILSVAIDLRKQGCEVAHLHNYSQFVPVLKLFNPRMRIVLHMHSEWLTQLDRKLIANRLKKVDRIIGVSDYITEKIRRRFPEFEGRYRTVHNGVDTARFTPAPGRPAAGQGPRLLFIGRISPEKGVHDLVEAFVIVARRCPGTRLRLIGSIGSIPSEFIVALSDDKQVTGLQRYYTGKYGDRLLGLIPPELKSQVAFTGFMPYPEIPAQYNEADILVNPSYSESFGLSLVEAMACGIPVIATRTGGMVEIVEHGRTGLLVDRGRPDALAKAIIAIWENPERRAEMGKAGRQRVLDLFTWERTAQTLETCDLELRQQPLSREVAVR